MRRTANLWPEITAFEALTRAALRAARGKRRVAGVARFLADLEPQCLRLQRELNDGSWRPGVAYRFEIHDPKQRTISAAPFADRVVHHALIDRLEPIFDRRMIAHSFACRRGKGTHAALACARRLLGRHDWFLKLDVARCFDSLRHDVVLETLARVLKDRRVLALCATIVRHGGVHAEAARDSHPAHLARPGGSGPPAPPGVGLPIGNLTSQWFANLVLDRLDHHVKERLRVPGYLRYMDDFVLFAESKAALRSALEQMRAFLAEPLGLTLKPRATILAPAHQGLPFLGWRLYRGRSPGQQSGQHPAQHPAQHPGLQPCLQPGQQPEAPHQRGRPHGGTMRLRPANLARIRQRLARRLWQQRHGLLDEQALAASLRSVAEYLAQGSTLALRRQLLTPIEPGTGKAARNIHQATH